ncbi:hypothetical protein LCGC14_0629520 [marine sediment metagenome]|uniref:Com family DNA-binding transcriptional regulator n=1 Tax=marine sediment metagenome TaxID=412755 RepID=A0A0F9RLZ1_9ZZZZ
MIDRDGFLRCDQCRKKLAYNLAGRVEIPCPRCKRHNIFDSGKLPYQSHKLVSLTSTL